MQVQRQIDELLALRASEWLELLPTATEAERKAFAAWLSESRLHVQAFLEIAEIEFALGNVDRERQLELDQVLKGLNANVVPLGRPPPHATEETNGAARAQPSEGLGASADERMPDTADSSVSSAPVPELGGSRSAVPASSDELITAPRSREQIESTARSQDRGGERWFNAHRRKLAGAFAAAASVSAIALFLLQSHAPRFSTAVGEQKTIELTDTSVVTLNALSQIEVDLEATERDVKLRHGEAIFTVAHDPQRPFRVHTRAGTVQAVGTQFNVYDRPSGETRVSVLEGRVQLTARETVTRNGQTDPAPAIEILAAGEEADIRLDGTIQRHVGAVVANTVAWRQRRLVFEKAALEDMVNEFNRYNPSIRLQLDGVPPGVYRFDGVFDAADPQSFVDLLSREPDLVIERRGDEVIVRSRGASGE
jgi:transmembrane sensor